MDATSSDRSGELREAPTDGEVLKIDRLNLDELSDELRSALIAENWDLVADLIEREWGMLLMKHFDLLREAFVVTPADAFADCPAARAVREMCYPIGLWVPGRARSELPEDRDDVLSLAENANAMDSLMAAHAAMIVMRLRAQWDRARRQAERLVVLLEAMVHRRFNDVARRMPGVEMQIGLTFLMAGDTTGALRHFRRAHDSADFDLLGYVGRDAAAKMAVVHALHGEIVQAQKWLARSDSTPASPISMSAHIESSLATARALVATARGDLEAMEAAARDMDGGATVEELWSLWLHARARLGLVRGDLVGSIRLLDTTQRALPNARQPPPFVQALLLADKVDLLIATGAGTHAQELLSATDLDYPLLGVSQARLWLHSGNHESAVHAAASVAGHPMANPLVDIEALVLAGAAQHRAGRRDESRASFEQAMSLASTHGCWIGFASASRSDVAAVAAQLDLELPANLPEVFPEALDVVDLTPRERVVLEHLHRGRTPAQIAEAEYVSINTVRSQVSALYRKLGVNARADALDRARAQGLV